MKKIAKKQTWRELTAKEVVEINGGDSRQNEKARNMWEWIITTLFI